MAFGIIGAQSGNIVEADPTFKTVRSTVYPEECLGWYSISGQTGAMSTVSVNGTLFSLKNTGPNILIVHRMWIAAIITTGFTTAQILQYRLLRANQFTGSDSGGTLLTVVGQNKYRSSNLNIQSPPDIRLSSTTVLTSGTKTVESTVMAQASFVGQTSPTTYSPQYLIQHDYGDYPVILAMNEGLVLQNSILYGAGGAVQIVVNMEYSEHESY